MQYRCFFLPLRDNIDQSDELNAFLRGHRVLSVEKHLVLDDTTTGWTFCVEYLESKPGAGGKKKDAVDYKEVLSEEDFAVFAKLREKRKELAEQEAIPAYAIFTNEELAQFVQNKVKTVADIQKIKGIGVAKAEKFGKVMLEILTAVQKNETVG